MPKGRRYTPEQIITKLREAEVLQSQGMSVEEAARTLRDSVSDLLSMAQRIWGIGYHPGQEIERPGKREPATQETGGRFVPGQCHLEGGAVKKVVSPDRRREAVKQVMESTRSVRTTRLPGNWSAQSNATLSEKD